MSPALLLLFTFLSSPLSSFLLDSFYPPPPRPNSLVPRLALNSGSRDPTQPTK
ncbi:hypothetical protein I79_002442 [Cricetulus griseus]|uniref:Uncharacterized protein n=1 Tax=Cricetulus griseus TaxID=10029 RepID=G3GXF2_CRIGR|nr:hypothetical protein I79_002442 [Cricetulus griseus]